MTTNTNTAVPKQGVFSGLKNILKSGGDKLKEKFTGIFKDKKDQPPTSPGKVQFNQNNTDNKKPIFTIEEDEDHKVYNYHLEEDDEDYDYDDHEDIKEESKTEDKAKIPKSPEKVIEKKSNPEAESKEKQEEEVLEDFDPYDIHTVCHRIYIRDSTVDLEGMNYVRCKRFKNKSKILSMIGVSTHFYNSLVWEE
jgi:hypothetical protein